DAVVELERSLERVVDEVRAALPLVPRPEKSPAVIDDQPQAHVALSEDVRSVRVEEALGVQRRTEQMAIEAVAIVARNLLSGGPSLGANEGAEESHASKERGNPPAAPGR